MMLEASMELDWKVEQQLFNQKHLCVKTNNGKAYHQVTSEFQCLAQC